MYICFFLKSKVHCYDSMEQILIRPQSFVRRLFSSATMFSINYDGRLQMLYNIWEVNPVKSASKWCMLTINIGAVRAGGF